ncbi:MAG: tRNA 2-selenouridine(34) synthase MnmH [Spirochaetales bacterium]|nr:tRNA 2-selenouridine(34) synthase MnmH [Spirochaetales bacterium]
MRSPAEYARGHIPGALSLPLFSDEERARVGTLYKESGRLPAILSGLSIVGPRLEAMAREALALCPDGRALLHCWRGGMRSRAAAFVFSTVGIETRLLAGGYKAFRSFARSLFERPLPYVVLAGKTGSGKTRALNDLALAGHQVLDLEHLARHRGSAFGDFDCPPQPSQEQFENDIAHCLMRMKANHLIWVECESRLLGRLEIPRVLQERFHAAPAIQLDVPVKDRIAWLVEEYRAAPKERLLSGLLAIRKRLGDDRVKKARQALDDQDRSLFAGIVLDYYDRTYEYGMSRRSGERWHFPVERLPLDRDRLLKFAEQKGLGESGTFG